MHYELKHKLMVHMVWMNISLEEEMHAESAEKFLFLNVLAKQNA